MSERIKHPKDICDGLIHKENCEEHRGTSHVPDKKSSYPNYQSGSI